MRLDFPDEQSHPGVRGHWLDVDYVPGVDPHEARGVPLAAPFHQDTLGFLFIRACLLLDVEDVPECQVGGAVILEPAEKDLAIVQKNGLVLGGKLEVATVARGQQGREQAEKQDGVPAYDAAVALLGAHNSPPAHW